MTNKEIIHDLKAIKATFIEETHGSYPVCLDSAIEIIKGVEDLENRVDAMAAELEALKKSSDIKFGDI